MSDQSDQSPRPILLSYASSPKRRWEDCPVLTHWLLIVTGIMSTFTACNAVLLGIDAICHWGMTEVTMFLPTAPWLALSAFLAIIFSIPFMILFCLWYFHAMNCAKFETFDSRLRYGGWHVLSWLVPVWNLIVPVQEFCCLLRISTFGTSRQMPVKWFVIWLIAWETAWAAVVMRLLLEHMGRHWNTPFVQLLLDSNINMAMALGFYALLYLVRSIWAGQFERWSVFTDS